MAEYLTFETDFRYPPEFKERVFDPPKTVTGNYGRAEKYNGGEIRKNYAGSWDAFFNGKCIRQTSGKGGALIAIDQRNPGSDNLF